MRKKILIAIFSLLLAITFLTACYNKNDDAETDTVLEDGLVFAPFSYERNEYQLIEVLDEREELVIPAEIDGKKVVAIGRSALYNKQKLKKAVIPESVVLIDDYAFDNCISLEEVVLSQRIKEIGFSAFSNCVRLREIALPASLEIIESSAFSRCSGLQRIYVSPSVKTIGRDAFAACTKLRAVYISSVAAWCGINFENIASNPISTAEKLYVSGRLTEDLLIEGVETISPNAFFGFKGIKNLTIGEGVSVIGESAFSGCSSIKNLTLSDSVKRINTSAFNSCTSLEYVSCGGGVEYFAGLAFYNCENIKLLNISDLSVWCRAFFYTDSTGSANPMLYAEALAVGGEEVTELVIPSGVERISTLSFIGFKGKRVTVPKTLKLIEDTAFYMCDNLEVLHFNGNLDELQVFLTSIGSNNFGNGINISYNG